MLSIIPTCSLYLQQAMPSSLPKVLNAVKWNQHKDVAVVSHLCVSVTSFAFVYTKVRVVKKSIAMNFYGHL